MKPPIFVKAVDEPDLFAHATLEEAVQFHEAYDADNTMAWDSTGLPLSVQAVDHRQIRFVASGEPAEPDELRRLLAEAMTLSGATFPEGATLDALQAYALVELRPRERSLWLLPTAGVVALGLVGLLLIFMR
jgi:hypothetical protein